ncbi:hypothetical protein M3223_16300 [Paenibacillus pasadenensis]|uniref:hypothetical protein n=1 Tax=Paenibacillus pasadenensis TaxID=217090 RepID=UPI00203D19AC|nr:hypothetical protein [Paenibacillus pasadenensis]MCM3748917.1 hypothetical protein [Paenibacillus pasadenensis]
MYDSLFRHEMEIRDFHQYHKCSVNKVSVKANAADYLGRASRRIWIPLHTVIMFAGRHK